MAAWQSRFWAKVDKNGPLADALGTRCWQWSGARSDGYGRFRLAGVVIGAHRLAYEVLVGDVPPGMTIDHLCRNRACVRPSHMEPVTRAENIRRGNVDRAAEREACRRGHPFHGANLSIRPSDGARICKTCARDRQRGYRSAARG